MVHTFLILDGHPGAFAPTQRPENTLLEPKGKTIAFIVQN